MAVTLNTLIQKVKHMDITLLAGKDGLQKNVRWVHMIETKDTTTFLDGEEIAITTGIGLTDKFTLFELVKLVYDNNGTGIIINTGAYIKEIPKKVISFCNENNFPLFKVPWKNHIGEIMRIFCYSITLSDRTEMEIATAFKNAIFLPSQRELYTISLTQKGIKPEFSFYCCTVFLPKAREDFSSLEDLSFRIRVRMEQSSYTNYSIFPYDDVVIIVLWNYEKDKIRSFMTELNSYLKTHLPKNSDFLLGVGKHAHDIYSLSQSFNQATEIQNLQYRHIIPKDHYFFEDLGIYNLLMSITDKEVFNDYYNDTLGELIEYDKNNDSNILEVLKYYLENNGSVQKTAEHFYVHRNSINYRLNKVQDILDMDISDLDNRIQLRLAFMVRDILD